MVDWSYKVYQLLDGVSLNNWISAIKIAGSLDIQPKDLLNMMTRKLLEMWKNGDNRIGIEYNHNVMHRNRVSIHLNLDTHGNVTFSITIEHGLNPKTAQSHYRYFFAQLHLSCWYGYGGSSATHTPSYPNKAASITSWPYPDYAYKLFAATMTNYCAEHFFNRLLVYHNWMKKVSI